MNYTIFIGVIVPWQIDACDDGDDISFEKVYFDKKVF